MTQVKQRKTAVCAVIFVIVLATVAALFTFVSPMPISAAEVADSTAFYIAEAQVRQHEGATKDESGGQLRFVVRVDAATLAEYPETAWQYGTLLLPENMLGDSELTFDTASKLDIPTSKWQKDEYTANSKTYSTYTAVLNGKSGGAIPESFYNRNIVARGYIKNKTSGEVIYTKQFTRSIGYVAAMNVAVDNSDNSILVNIANKTNKEFSFVDENTDRKLFENGASNGYTLLFDGKNSTVKTAVDFFNGQLKALTGTNLGYHGSYNGYNGTDDWSKEPTTWSASDKYIVFGNKANMTELAKISIPESLIAHEGYYITTKGNSIFVYANNDEAYQLAVIKLLDVLTGYEMYAADCVTFTSDGKNINIPDMQIIVEPDFDYRNRGNYLSVGGGIYGMGYTTNNIFMAVGQNSYLYHTALDLLDPSTYYKSHNDWFYLYSQNDSLLDSIVGNQRYDHYQICYSTVLESTEALNIMYSNLKTVIQANPGLENISLGPADNNYVCDCSKCTSAKTTYGSNAGTYILVANKLAEMVAADTDLEGRAITLVAFAYRQYETAPTGVTMHDNVGVMIAPIEANWSTPLREQTNVKNNIAAWAALTDNMYFWFYQTNFDQYFYPLNSYGVMADNIKFAKENDAKYLFYQGAGDKNVSHFSKLKDYVESKLMVDSSLDYNTLVDNFFNAYYGAGATAMKEYFYALQEHMNGLSSTGGYKEAIATTSNWPKDKLIKFMGYINSAYAAVEADGSTDAYIYNARIKLESLFPRFALITLYGDTTTAGTENNFAMDCKALEIVKYNEAIALYDYDGEQTVVSDYSSWWSHACSSYSEKALDRCLKSGATLDSPAIYYKTCSSCGAIGSETFTNGDPIAPTAIDTPITLEQGNSVTLENAAFTVGNATVTIAGETKDIQITEAGKLVVTTDAIPIGETTILVRHNGSAYLYTNVLYVTRVINTFADLSVLNSVTTQNLSGYYILGGNIDAQNQNIAAGSAWNSGFQGTFDGRGYSISNLSLGNGASYSGIFGAVNGGTIKNITFDNVQFVKGRASLFGRCLGNLAGTDTKTTIENVTVNITAWDASATSEVGVFSFTKLENTEFVNTVVNVSNGITVPNLLGAELNSSNTDGDLTVNLGVGSKITYYYGTTTEKPTFVTVTEKIAQTIDTETIIEGNTMSAESLSDGAVSVTLGGNSYSGTVSGGVLTISDLPTATGKQTSDVVITQGDNTYTYTNVWHVTQVIDNAEELTSFAASSMAANTANTTLYGYYVLDDDIDCNGASVATGGGIWNSGGFMGTLDGRGYKISNMLVNNQGGLFGRMGMGSTVKDIHFENTAFAANSALFGKVTYKSNFKNVTVDIESWASVANNMTYAGVLGISSNTTSSFDNFVINVADGVSVSCLLGREFTGATGNITVNLGVGSTIVNYYTTDSAGEDAVTVADGSIIIVNKTYEPVEETHDELVAAEGTTSLTISNALLTVGNASVSVNGGAASTVAVTTAGQITIDITGQTMGKLENGIVITTPKGDTLTYTEVWYVTQVIDNATELKTLGAACKTANTTGYYILGGDIDCSAEANMATGDPGWKVNGFSGTFDGRGKTISNITMKYDDATGGYGGLFGNLAGCTIQNVVFDKVNYASVHAALLGRHSYASGGINVTLENLTINISAWGATGEAGLFMSRGTLNTLYNNCIVNVADGLTIHNLLGQEWESNYGTGIIVNLGNGSTITSYYYADTATAQTTPPSIMTVNAPRTPVTETLDTLVAGEGATNVTFTHGAFADSTSATVVINGVTKENVAISNGALTLNLADYGVSAMGQVTSGAVITTNLGDKLTYTEVWYVTQVINDATELKALGAACYAANTTGYYILGGDIDCSAEANMAAGNPGWEAKGFSGTFNGRNKTISNIKMTGYGGLFGNLDGCLIENVIFDKVDYASDNAALLGRHTYKNLGTDNTRLNNLTINVSNWAATGEAGLLVSRSSRNTLFNGITVNVADGVTVHNLLGQGFNSSYGSGITVNLGTESTVTAYYWTGTDVSTAVTTAPSFIKVQ